ncbi:hypothetical protein H0H93_013099 [Arthromyces matolae]|nr:hypothetical protein H0H93_013099 [Arthromyces matolae]
MVNPSSTESPKASYAQITASPKPDKRANIPTQSTPVKVKGEASKTKNNRNPTANESMNPGGTASVPPKSVETPSPRPLTGNTKGTLKELGANPSSDETNDVTSQPNATRQAETTHISPPTNTSPGNRYNNAELPALPRPKSRKSNRREKKDARKSPQAIAQDHLNPLPPINESTPHKAKDSSNALTQTRLEEEDDDLTPKAATTTMGKPSLPTSGGNSVQTPNSLVANSTDTNDSPPRIPSKAKGKGKELPIPSELPRTLLLSQPDYERQSHLKRKFEDTPSKSKPPTRNTDFQPRKSNAPANEVHNTYTSKTVDPFVHPSQREPVYSDDPEPGVLPDPAYYSETPPFLRYPKDEHLMALTNLMTTKGATARDDFEVRKEGVRLQELARLAGARPPYSDSGESNMQIDDHPVAADDRASQLPEVPYETSLPPSPSPLPRGRNPTTPNPTHIRPHSSQGIPVRFLFTNEYERQLPTQYTRSLDTHSLEDSDDVHQNASEASYNESDVQSLPSGAYPGIFQEDVIMSDAMSANSPAPPYQGNSEDNQPPNANQQPPDHEEPNAGTAGPHDPLRAWTPSDVPGVKTNCRNLQIVSTPPNGWPKIYVTYHPMLDLNDESLAIVEMARAPGTCWGLPFKSNNTKHEQLGFVDGIKRTIADMVTLQPGQAIGVTRMESESSSSKRKTRFAYPHFVLITGLNRDQKEYLVDQHAVIVSEEVSFLIYPMEVSQKLFVGTIAGLHYEEKNIEIVRNLVRQTLRGHNELESIMAAGSPNHVHADFTNLIDNTTISFVSIGKEGDANYTRGWNVILPPHSMNTTTTKQFAEAVRNIPFTILGFGKGSFMHPDNSPHCEGCKSLGHSWQDCPYPKLTGWRGPKPSESKDNSTDTNNQYNWFNSNNNTAASSTSSTPGGNSQRGRAVTRGGGQYRGRGNRRGNGRGGRRF